MSHVFIYTCTADSCIAYMYMYCGSVHDMYSCNTVHVYITLMSTQRIECNNSQHFGTASFPANIAAENSKTSV